MRDKKFGAEFPGELPLLLALRQRFADRFEILGRPRKTKILQRRSTLSTIDGRHIGGGEFLRGFRRFRFTFHCG